jgi:adenylate cyclase
VAALVALLALPLAGLWLLVERPGLDVTWEHHPAHFWLVLAVAGISVALGAAMSEASRRRGDARLFLVALAFLVSAGFLGLHALATPGVLLAGKNAGFVVATPVGLLVAAGFAAASSLDLDPKRSETIMRLQRPLRAGVALLLAAWAAVSLAGLTPLDEPLPPEQSSAPLKGLAAAGIVLYGYAALNYYRLYRRRPALLLLAIAGAFILLAEAMIVVAYSRNWHASWWEWHVLMAVAFGLVAVAARVERRHGGSVEGPFGSMYLEHTIARVDAGYGAALEELVAAQREGRPVGPLAQEVARRYGLGAEQARLLERAAGQVRRIDELFRPYVSPQLAARLEADPHASELGGVERDVSILFADLQGFTAFTERSSAAEVIAMLNEYWGITVPVVLREHEGVIERFAGDAVMVVFNAGGDQPDHALRAARAALAMQAATERIAAGRPGWPRFRAGINSGPAIVGNVGSAEQRSFAAIGDTTNLASRLQAEAEAGQIVAAAVTVAALGDGVRASPLGPLELKGKSAPVEAFVLHDLAR